MRARLAKDPQGLEVEHLFPLATECRAPDVPSIHALATEQGWGRVEGGAFRPSRDWSGHGAIPMEAVFGRWIVAITAYLLDGLDGLVALACKPPPSCESVRTVAVALLRPIGTGDAAAAAGTIVATLTRATSRRRGAPASPWGDERETLFKAVNAANLILFPPSDVALTTPQERALREALHGALELPELQTNERAGVYCALRWVGDEESVSLIARQPTLEEPWRGMEKKVAAQVKKRSRAGGRKPPRAAAPQGVRLPSFASSDIELDVLRATERAGTWIVHAGTPKHAPEVELAIELSRGDVVLRSVGARSDAFLAALARAYRAVATPRRLAHETRFAWVSLVGTLGALETAKLATKLFHERAPYCELYLNVDLPNGVVGFLEKDEDYRAPLLRALSKRARRG